MDEEGLEEPKTSAVEELARDPASRRRFLRTVGGTGAAGALALFIAACGGSSKQKLTPGGSNARTGAGTGTDRFGRGDAGIVSYALFLEYVESELYKAVLAGGLLKGRAQTLAQRFSEQEQQHVARLEAMIPQLGGDPPVRPEVKFTLDNPSEILNQLKQFEGLGAAAYLGQAGRIESQEVLAAALAIHSVEGRHAAALQVLTGDPASPDGAFAQPESAANVIESLQPYLVQ
jgi:hypothetical protein